MTRKNFGYLSASQLLPGQMMKPKISLTVKDQSGRALYSAAKSERTTVADFLGELEMHHPLLEPCFVGAKARHVLFAGTQELQGTQPLQELSIEARSNLILARQTVVGPFLSGTRLLIPAKHRCFAVNGIKKGTLVGTFNLDGGLVESTAVKRVTWNYSASPPKCSSEIIPQRVIFRLTLIEKNMLLMAGGAMVCVAKKHRRDVGMGEGWAYHLLEGTLVVLANGTSTFVEELEPEVEVLAVHKQNGSINKVRIQDISRMPSIKFQ